MAETATVARATTGQESRETLDSAVVRFAGDSGDGIQLTGGRFTISTALAGNDLATFPDFPAEIRAPTGTTYGVSAFQINFGARSIRTAGDAPDVLVALNPAALKVNLEDLRPGGMLVVDAGTFAERNLRRAGYESNPLDDGTLEGCMVVAVDISGQTKEAVKHLGLSARDALRCKNMFALGLVYWLFDRDRAATADWLRSKFTRAPEIAEANIAALNAGHAFGETAELSGELAGWVVRPAAISPGLYRTVTGQEALAWGLVDGARRAGLRITFCSYPITPASSLLHELARIKHFDVLTFQAEDEIAAICAAIGASYAGAIGITSSSGPGIALKTEALGLAIAAELPLVVVNSQRAGPSTGLPTKTEQSDLYQAVFGRNADSPLVVLAAHSPADCFEVAAEAVRIATRFMTPVMLLTDGYIANASEPWLIPEVKSLPAFEVKQRTDPEGFQPFDRDPRTLARPWAVPGTPGLQHRVGGLERDSRTGNISYDPANHELMTRTRFAKVAGVADDIPEQAVEQGAEQGPIAVIGWGSTFGPISRAVANCRADGVDVAHIHLRHIWPLPRNLGELLQGYERILVPEMNMGQLVTLLRSTYLVPAEGLNKVTGRPFTIVEIEAAIRERLGSQR